MLAAEGHEAAAVPGRSSQFDVVADGRVVYSKYETGRFPAHDEVLRALTAG